MRLYNFAHVQSDRLWLQNILVSDSSDSGDDSQDEPITEEYFQEMLKLHLYKKKYQQKFYSSPEVSLYLFIDVLFIYLFIYVVFIFIHLWYVLTFIREMYSNKLLIS